MTHCHREDLEPGGHTAGPWSQNQVQGQGRFGACPGVNLRSVTHYWHALGQVISSFCASERSEHSNIGGGGAGDSLPRGPAAGQTSGEIQAQAGRSLTQERALPFVPFFENSFVSLFKPRYMLASRSDSSESPSLKLHLWADAVCAGKESDDRRATAGGAGRFPERQQGAARLKPQRGAAEAPQGSPDSLLPPTTQQMEPRPCSPRGEDRPAVGPGWGHCRGVRKPSDRWSKTGLSGLDGFCPVHLGVFGG